MYPVDPVNKIILLYKEYYNNFKIYSKICEKNYLLVSIFGHVGTKKSTLNSAKGLSFTVKINLT